MSITMIIIIAFVWLFAGWFVNGLTNGNNFFPEYKKMNHMQRVDMWFFILFSPLAITCLLIYIVLGKIIKGNGYDSF